MKFNNAKGIPTYHTSAKRFIQKKIKNFQPISNYATLIVQGDQYEGIHYNSIEMCQNKFKYDQIKNFHTNSIG